MFHDMLCLYKKNQILPPMTPPKNACSFPASRARIRMSEACRGPRAGGSRGSESLVEGTKPWAEQHGEWWGYESKYLDYSGLTMVNNG